MSWIGYTYTIDFEGFETSHPLVLPIILAGTGVRNSIVSKIDSTG